MIGIENINITQDMLRSVGDIEAFRGGWGMLETQSTGLTMLREVAEYGADFRRLLGALRDQSLTPATIRTLGAMLEGRAGRSDFRTLPLPMTLEGPDGESAGTIETAAPEDIEPLLHHLCVWINEILDEDALHPLIAMGVFTATFLQIAPFGNGNTRLARFLLVLLMLKSGYTYAPFMPLEKIMAVRGAAIAAALQHNRESLDSGTPDWSLWLLCFLDVLRAQKDALRSKMTAGARDLSHLPTLSAKILRLFEHHNRLQMQQIVKLTNGRRSTIKLRIGEMVERGQIRRYGTARATWYSLV